MALAVAVGCGGERTFSGEELVAELNTSGAEVALGEPLASSQESIEVYGLTFAEPSSATEPGEQHGGGSLTVTDDVEAARAEFAQCEGAVTLLCYRAANVVIVLEDSATKADTSRLEGAIRNLEASD